MDKHHLNNYYPDGISMEDRLFEMGAARTNINLGASVLISLVGLLLGGLGALVAIDNTSAGVVMMSLGGLGVIVGIFLISLYNSGFKCLMQAELLYNTRMAGMGGASAPEEAGQSFEAPKSAPSSAAAPSAAPSGWTCTCGKTNASYMTSCPRCGTSKRYAKDVVPAPAATPSGWTCTCGKQHPAYVSTCSCGVNKRDIH